MFLINSSEFTPFFVNVSNFSYLDSSVISNSFLSLYQTILIGWSPVTSHLRTALSPCRTVSAVKCSSNLAGTIRRINEFQV
ncbi:hypothetical protein X975_18641, partial [Stegodyphus mimosarum]